MDTMKWQDLLDYINSSDVDLESDVILYDHSTGEEYECTLIEMNEDKRGWVPTLAFNLEDNNDVEEEE